MSSGFAIGDWYLHYGKRYTCVGVNDQGVAHWMCTDETPLDDYKQAIEEMRRVENGKTNTDENGKTNTDDGKADQDNCLR